MLLYAFLKIKLNAIKSRVNMIDTSAVSLILNCQRFFRIGSNILNSRRSVRLSRYLILGDIPPPPLSRKVQPMP
jgi:hypothetical protein